MGWEDGQEGALFAPNGGMQRSCWIPRVYLGWLPKVLIVLLTKPRADCRWVFAL